MAARPLIVATLLHLALLTSPALCVSVLMLLNAFNPFAALDNCLFAVENRSGERLIVTPIGTSLRGAGRLQMMESDYPAFDSYWTGGYELLPAESRSFIYRHAPGLSGFAVRGENGGWRFVHGERARITGVDEPGTPLYALGSPAELPEPDSAVRALAEATDLDVRRVLLTWGGVAPIALALAALVLRGAARRTSDRRAA